MVREGRVLSEAAVCSYPRGKKDEMWWLPRLSYIWRARERGELAEGQHSSQELTSAGLSGGNILNRDVQDSLLVCHGPHIVLSSVLDLCVRDSVVENEGELMILPVAVRGWTQSSDICDDHPVCPLPLSIFPPQGKWDGLPGNLCH